MPKRSTGDSTRNSRNNHVYRHYHAILRLGVVFLVLSVAVFQLEGSSKVSFWNDATARAFTSYYHDSPQQTERRAFLETDDIDSDSNVHKNVHSETTTGLQLLLQPQKETSPPEATATATARKKKPLNVLILYPDDWRHDTLGGVAPVVRTPFLNRLAQDGIRFTHNMVTTSICWVSRATFFTGQYASRHHSYRLKTPKFYKTWYNTSWPALLQQHANYFTAHIGKWQYANPNRTVESLFDYTNIFEGRHSYPNHRDRNGQGGPTTISAAAKTYQEVKRFLEKRPKDRPFAMTAAFYPPKAIGNSFAPGGQWFPQNRTRELYYDNATIPRPYNESLMYSKLPRFFHRAERAGRSRWEERFETDVQYQMAMKNYYSLVTEVDEACRDIVQELEAQGILNETLIIFTTDNGMFLGEHGLAGKWYPYQESIRVPLIIRDPRMPKALHGTLNDALTLNIDLQATILDAAGLAPPIQSQGRNIADLYLPTADEKHAVDGSSTAESTEATVTTTTSSSNSRRLENNPWRTEFFYEFPLDMTTSMPMSSAVVRKDLKYIHWPQFHYSQLFNLTEDPLEMNDLRKHPEYQEVMQELKDRHDDLIQQVK